MTWTIEKDKKIGIKKNFTYTPRIKVAHPKNRSHSEKIPSSGTNPLHLPNPQTLRRRRKNTHKNYEIASQN